jgi:outer membrane protein assembly factor BamB
MRKRALTGLIVLCLAILACFCCGRLYFELFFERKTSCHISGLTPYGQSIYFGAGGCLYRLDTQDRALEKLECTGTFGRPAVDGKRVYAQVDELLVAVDLSTGKTSWRVDESQYGYIGSAHEGGFTSVAQDRIITMREKGIHVYDTSGHILWRTEYGEASWCSSLKDGLFWHTADGVNEESGPRRLTGVDLDTGNVHQIVDLPSGIRLNRLLSIDDTWIVATVAGTEKLDHIGAVERAQPHEMAWISEAFCRCCDVVIWDDLLIVYTGSRAVYALDIHTGQVMWRFDAYADNAAGDHVERIIPVLLLVPGARLYGVDTATGAKIWEYALKYRYGSHGVTEPVIIAGAVYIGNRDSIDVLDLETGTLLWQVEVDSSIIYLVSRTGL